MSLTDDSQYFYPSIAGHLTEAQRQAKWVNRILHWAWLVDTYNEFEKALDPAHLKIMEAAGIQISEEWWYDLRWPRPELPELVVKQMELFKQVPASRGREDIKVDSERINNKSVVHINNHASTY